MVYGLGTIIPRFLNYVIMAPYFTRLFEKENIIEYGKVTELYAYIAFFMVVLTYGMETAFFRFVQIESNKKKVFSTILTSISITSLLFFIIIFLSTDQISLTLDYKGESIFIRLLAGILAIEAFTAIPFAKLRIEERAKRFSILKLIQVSVNIIFMVSVYNIIPGFISSNSYLLNDDGLISAHYIFIANLIANGFVIIFLLPEFKDYSFKLFDIKLLKPILIYGLPLMASQIGGVINESLDRAVYKHIVGEKEGLYDLAIYGANYKIAALIMIIIQMYRYAAEPFFFNTSKDIDSKDQLSKMMNLFVGIIVGISLIIVVYLDYFKFIIGSDYREGVFVVPIIVLSYVLGGILFNLSAWFKLSGKTQYAIIITLVGAAITITINFIFVPKLKYLASAYAHVVAYTVMVVISYILGQRFYKVNYNIGRIFSYLGIGILIYAITNLLDFESRIVLDIIKLLMVALFIIFVIWREKLFKLIISKK